MHRSAFLAPLTFALAIAATPALAEPASITVTLSPAMQARVDDLGAREVQDQTDRLVQVVERTLVRRGALDGARIDLVVTDLKPNRPTFQQLSDRPGLDGIRSVSIGGAAFEGEVTTADGQVSPLRYDWFSSSINDVYGFSTWQDAERAYQRLAVHLANARYVRR